LVLRAIRQTPKSTRQAVLAGRGGRLKRPERQNVGRCRSVTDHDWPIAELIGLLESAD